MNLDSHWTEILDLVRQKVPQQTFKTWFAPLAPVPDGNGSLEIGCPDYFFRDWFSEHQLQALNEAGDIWAVQRLRWFANDFVRADVIDGRLTITDLRMGQEPTYVFRHTVAQRGNPHWQAIPPERMMVLFDGRDLGKVFERILNP